MRILLLCLFISLLISCKERKVKYSGLNDLMVGVQQIVLYENGEFYLELSLGGSEGKYTISNDTVNLVYDDKPNHWPDQLVIRDRYFETVLNDEHSTPIRIYR